jgi:hypothetical protein
MFKRKSALPRLATAALLTWCLSCGGSAAEVRPRASLGERFSDIEIGDWRQRIKTANQRKFHRSETGF